MSTVIRHPFFTEDTMFTFHEVYISLRFPQKLWKIVNDSKTNAIKWNRNGNSILINYKEFQDEYLNAASNPFKTTRFQSFIRQLNLYGFRKVKSHMRPREYFDTSNVNVHEFFHANFIRGRCDLLTNIVRKTGGTRVRTNKSSMATTCDRQKSSKKVHLYQMALSKALEKVSVKIDFQTYNDRDSTFKNEVTEVVDNIVQDSKSSASDCETNENWDYSKWLEETSNKYNTLQCASDISNDNNELPCLESTTLIPKQEIQDNGNVGDLNNLQSDTNDNEQTLAWDGILYNDKSEQLYAMFWANEKKNITPKVIAESLDQMSYQSPACYDHGYSIPLNTSTVGVIWN